MKLKSLLSLAAIYACLSALGQCPNYTATNTQTGTCVEPAGDIEFFGVGNITLTINGDLTVNGNFTIRDDVVVNGTLTVAGDIIARSGSLTIGDGGTVDVGDDFRPQNGLTSFFDITVLDGGLLLVADNFDATNLSGLDVQDGGAVDVGGNFTTGVGSVTTIDGNFNVDGDFTNESAFGVDAALEGTGVLTVGGTYTNNGDDTAFTGTLNGDPLPVELIYFGWEMDQGGVILKWTTASEINNDGFEVERSSDGMTFSSVGFVQGFGTTNETHEYSYFDRSSYSERSYYRLKQIDYDGQYEYSPIIAINGESLANKLEAYPNPTNGSLRLLTAISNYQLYDEMGRIIKNVSSTTSYMAEQEISQFLTNAKPGTYLLVSEIDGKPQKLRLIKH